MENCKEISTPMATNYYLDSNEKGASIDQTEYIGLIGSLLYLTVSRPDIMFSVCLVPDFNPILRNHTSLQQREF